MTNGVQLEKKPSQLAGPIEYKNLIYKSIALESNFAINYQLLAYPKPIGKCA